MNPRRPLGYRGTQVLRFIRRYRAEHGASPSYATICDALGIHDKSTLRRIVVRLEKRGLLRRSASPGYKRPILRID
jgi:DNA-binding IclR family transcriptional regulator